MSAESNAPSRMTALATGVEQGIKWAIVRAPMWWAINGYARVPDDHPWHGLDYDEIDVAVNGGLTYARDDWIGFDTMHAFDYWPGQPHHFHDDCCIHWTESMVIEEAKNLARQVAATSALLTEEPTS